MVSPGVLTLLGTAFVAVCGLAGGLGASWISKRATDKANERAAELQARTVDREEFDSLTRELRADLDRLRNELNIVRGELTDEHDARVRAEQRADDADIRASTAAAKATRLERRISQLEEVLRAHDMPVPPSLD